MLDLRGRGEMYSAVSAIEVQHDLASSASRNASRILMAIVHWSWAIGCSPCAGSSRICSVQPISEISSNWLVERDHRQAVASQADPRRSSAASASISAQPSSCMRSRIVLSQASR